MLRILSFALICSLTACSQRPAQPVNSPETNAQPAPVLYPMDSFNTGVVIPSVHLRADTSQTFALYLPKSYNDSAKLPVIVFFDPHGAGAFPVGLYSDLAEKFNFILMGSNSSRNGLSFEQTGPIGNNLVNEAKNRFHVNPGSVTLCGHSGGAKVALLCAAENQDVQAVIYSGADVQITPNHPISILGIAGLKDMNYTDLVSFEWAIKDPNIKHYMIEWPGIHEFPSAEVFKDAFTFTTTGTIPDYDKKRVTITPGQVEEEQRTKGEYLRNFQTQDVTWWKKEVARLNGQKKTNIMDERLLGFISLACYSISNGQLQQNNLDVAEKILAIYKLADPKNKDCDSLYSVLRKKQGK